MSESLDLIVQPFVTQQQMDSAETLPCAEPSIDIGDEVVSASSTSICDSKQSVVEYDDIMYLPSTRAFYLLSSEAVERIQHAESQLESLFFSVSDEEKYQGLAKAGLMDSFISADLASFLEGQEKQDFIEARELAENPHKQAMPYVKKGLEEEPNGQYNPNKFANAIQEYEKARSDNHFKYGSLKKKALSKAETLGYRYQNGALYSPREVKIQKQIQRYIKAKAEFLGKKELPPQAQIDELKKQIVSLQSFANSAAYSVKGAAQYAYQFNLNKLAKQEKALAELMGAIESLAMYSIATPEYALGNDGHVSLASYYALHKEIADIRTSINKKMKAADDASNKYANMLPQAIFKDELDKIKQLQQKALDIKMVAQQNAMNFDNSMYLLWDVEQYKPKPLSRLAKGSFPLREYVTLKNKPDNALGKGFSQLRYLSLTQLPQKQQKTSENTVSIKQSSTNSQGLFYVETSPEKALLELLGPQIKKVTVKEEWFDESGIFKPENLFDYLNSQQINVAKLSGDVSGWQQAIVELLYSKEIEKRLNPFDASPQAQMFRMVTSTSAITDTNMEWNLTVPSSDKLTVAKFESAVEFSAARGEINLFKALTGKDYLRYPEKVDMTPFDVSYIDRQGVKQTIKFDNGGLQLRFYCKAYGFIGACIQFSPEVALTRSADSTTGSHLAVTGYKVMQETGMVELDSVKAFLSAEAGIELGSSVDWHLPENIPAFALDGVVSNNNTVLPLMKAAVKLDVSAGIKFPIRFRMKSGIPHVQIQVGPPGAKIAFEGEMDPSAIGIWVTQFQRLLRQCKYRKITLAETDEGALADQESFDFMTSVSRAMLCTQLNVGLFLAQGKDRLDSILSFLGRSERAGMLGHILSTSQDEAALREWMVLQPPEAIGPMLRTLIAEPEAFELNPNERDKETVSTLEAHVWQQTAIANIVKWLFEANDSVVFYASNQIDKVNASQRQMEEAVIRMNASSQSPSHHPLKVEALFKHREELESFMALKPNFTEKTRQLERTYLSKVKVFEGYFNKLLIHTEDWMTAEMQQQIQTAKVNEALRYVN